VRGVEFLQRFVREAKLASKIKSEHVVRVLDVARLESGEPYIVMELLEGQDLGDMLVKHGPLPVQQAALYLLQACEALADAHGLGIVHRDLKPANLFLTTTRDGRPCIKVLDFGISKLVGADAAQSMTKTNALMGSPLYMSPDQLVQSRDVDARSDVWALGVTLFELLSGRCPFLAEEAPQLIAQILQAPTPPLRSVRPDAPAELEALVNAALVKDRAQRVPDVAAFARGLAPFAPELGRFSVDRITGLLARSGRLSSSGVVSVGGGPPGGATPASGTNPAWSTAPISHAVTPSATAGGAAVDLSSTQRKSRALPIALVLGGLAALAAGFLLFRSPGAPEGSEPSAPAAPVASPAPSPVTAPASPVVAAAPTPEPAAASEPAAPSASGSAPSASAGPALAKPQLRKPGAAPAAPPASPAQKPATAAPAADPFGGVR
jgi:serine/threonine protein kinase